MNVSQVISDLRGIVKEYSTGSHFEDQFLWSIYNSSKNTLIKRRLNKYNKVSPLNFRQFCLGTEDNYSHMCGCVTVGCQVKTTIYELPEFLCGRNVCTLSVLLLNGQKIDEIQESDYDIVQENDITKDKPAYSIANSKIVLWNTTTQAVLVRAIWSDVTSFENIQYCTDSNFKCKDVYSLQVDSDSDLHYDALRMTLQLLKIPLSVMGDITGDSQEEIKQ